MGVSTDGILCFGIPFEEDFEFPWSKIGNYQSDVVEWWRQVSGYKPVIDIYDHNGQLKSEFIGDDNAVSRYYDHMRQWDEAHSMPIELVIHCSDRCPMFILSIKDTLITALRGYPKAVDLNKLKSQTTLENKQILLGFCESYGIDLTSELVLDPEPKWYLASYWG